MVTVLICFGGFHTTRSQLQNFKLIFPLNKGVTNQCNSPSMTLIKTILRFSPSALKKGLCPLRRPAIHILRTTGLACRPVFHFCNCSACPTFMICGSIAIYLLGNPVLTHCFQELVSVFSSLSDRWGLWDFIYLVGCNRALSWKHQLNINEFICHITVRQSRVTDLNPAE